MHDRTARPKRAKGELSRDIIAVADDGQGRMEKTDCVGVETWRGKGIDETEREGDILRTWDRKLRRPQPSHETR